MPGTVTIEAVESSRGRAGRMFVAFPHRLFRGCAQWVPQFRGDIRAILDRRNSFFARSRAAFFVALRDGRAVGTIAALENVPYNEHHGFRNGHFYFFDSIDDREVSRSLFDAAFGWMRRQGLRVVQGPFGFGMMGSGILIDGFEHRAAMTMMNWNFPYYRGLVEAEGFAKYKDQYSAFFDPRTFRLPDRVRRVAEIALKRGSFEVPEFRTKKDLLRYAQEIGRVYNESFEAHGDTFAPMSQKEIDEVADGLVAVADPTLIKLLLYKGEIAGFLFGFPDLSSALKRSRGRIHPLAALDILLEYRRTRGLIVNGAAILPKYQRLGGNALLYYVLEKIGTERRFLSVDAVQIAETTELMLADLTTLGGRFYKTHRVYTRTLE